MKRKLTCLILTVCILCFGSISVFAGNDCYQGVDFDYNLDTQVNADHSISVNVWQWFSEYADHNGAYTNVALNVWYIDGNGDRYDFNTESFSFADNGDSHQSTYNFPSEYSYFESDGTWYVQASCEYGGFSNSPTITLHTEDSIQ